MLYAGGGQYGPYVKMAELFAGMFMDDIKSSAPDNPQDHWLNDYCGLPQRHLRHQPPRLHGRALIPERAYATCAIQVYNQPATAAAVTRRR